MTQVAYPNALPSTQELQARNTAVREFQQFILGNLKEGIDFDKIEGTQKPTLLKPGAEVIDALLDIRPHYELVSHTEDWSPDGYPVFAYIFRCQLISRSSGQIVGEGTGECNSYESRYRYRNAQRACPDCGGFTIYNSKAPRTGFFCWANKGGCGANFPANDSRITNQQVGKVENDVPHDLINTLVKMGEKRSHVAATLQAGCLSEVFTQDLDDIMPTATPGPPAAEKATAPPAAAQATQEPRAPGAAAEALFPPESTTPAPVVTNPIAGFDPLTATVDDWRAVFSQASTIKEVNTLQASMPSNMKRNPNLAHVASEAAARLRDKVSG